MRVLTKVLQDAVTYDAGPFMQTRPRFLQQIFPQCNTKHFSMTAKEKKK